MKAKQTPPRNGYQIVEEKLRDANAYLKNADLSLVHEALEKTKFMLTNKKTFHFSEKWNVLKKMTYKY